ncbi:hypothetical protein DSL64_21685 [Dyadobacter luteus]|uniref:DUF4935 domain-containing protein n=1 Tax=Dyadobacter luteus TaxID=2259619 RepID=A0A3D8Y7I8_9BACT|nr:hypothetical protein [Dyadobacter luteus]REA58221.1 hypothetical protein DSL64_21685 [Dyadobacter luteus]
MGNVCCLLDACTVINLIHIDDDDFLLKKIKRLDLHINETVFDEIRSNVYDRLSNNDSKYNNEEKVILFKKEIDRKVSFFRGKKSDNAELLKDLGSSYFNDIKEITGYTKKTNGELCSTAYALYLSRFNEKKIFFYTDDFPAKEFFSDFFEFQQIGQIKDTVDFLIFLYWIDEDFNTVQLDRILSDLYSQYAVEVTILKGRLNAFYREKVNGVFVKSQKDIASMIRDLVSQLENLDFRKLMCYWIYFESNKSRCKEVFDIIKQFHSVFEIETDTTSDTLLKKIQRTRSLIKKKKIYKWGDLILN